MYEKTTTYQQKHAYTQNHLQPQISTLDLKDGIYSESLTRTAWTRSSESGRKFPPFIIAFWKRVTSFEERALLSLVRANFKHDTQFRLGIISFIPILLIYMVYGFIVSGSNVRDPLAPLPDTQVMTNILLGIAVVIMPYMMLSVMQSSKSWQAAWIFFTTPFDRVKMIRSVDRVILWLLILPIGLLMCGMFTYMYGNFLHAVMHTGFMVLMSVTGLTFLNMFSIRLPFALESRPGNQMGGSIGPMITAAIIFGIPIAIIGSIGYGGYLGWMICLLAALILNWALGRGRNHRIRKVAATWEFPG